MTEKFTSEPPLAAKSPTYVPEFFRLPKTGERDPFFGNSRSQYYVWEREGIVKLVHLRPRGKRRGLCYVPYDAVAAHIRSAQQNGGAE
jgi:hypothetical protein